VKHFANFDYLCHKRPKVAGTDYIEVARHDEMAFQLRRRRKSVSKKSTEFPLALLAASFDNVGLYGHSRTYHLTPQRHVGRSPDSAGDSMRVQRQSARVMPYAKLLEVGHTLSIRPSMARTGIISLRVANFSFIAIVRARLVELRADSGQRSAGSPLFPVVVAPTITF
jgi:hypothetical protein